MQTASKPQNTGQGTRTLVDDLVHEDVVALAQPGARIVRVGKRGGCQSTPQSYIEKLMISALRSGEAVVRLKGADPFIFGRGGEESKHLQAACIAVNEINGITSGLAAVTALGVPLTHRQHARSVLFVTGHARPGGSGTDWTKLAESAHREHLTLTIYMGVSGAGRIQHGLLAGLPAQTPVTTIQNATLVDQRHAVCALADLHDTLEREGLGSPSVIVVGDVLRGLAATQCTAPAARQCA